MGLVLLGDVVLGVLLQVTELTGRLQPGGHRLPLLAFQARYLGFQGLQALGRDRLAFRLFIFVRWHEPTLRRSASPLHAVVTQPAG